MDGQQNFLCNMCVFRTAVGERLMQHYVRRHRFDPRFRVTCTVNNCGAVYVNWNSFKQHLRRNHRERHAILPQDNDDVPFDYDFAHHPHDEQLGNIHAEIRPLDAIKLQSARFLMHVRDVCNTSQRAVESVMQGTLSLISSYKTLLMEELRNAAENGDGYLSFEDVQQTANLCPTSIVFSDIDSKFKLDAFVQEKLNFIAPVPIEMRRGLVWRRSPTPTLVEKVFKGYYIPLLDSLKRMLRNDDVRYCVENPLNATGTMKTVLHGKYFREHPFFSTNVNPLAIILYYDELEITNPIGSKTHKLGMFYWTLANIYPELRSSLKVINLYAIARYADIQKAGIAKVLREFSQEIQILQRDGITVEIRGQNRNFKGSLLMVAGDTPASAAVGGFKKSVSAKRPCRRCMTGQVQLRHYFTENMFELRSLERHLEQLEAVCEPNITAAVRKFWSKEYGINERTELLSIEHFDVTKSLCQDTMHVIAEGTLEVEVRLFLDHCVRTRGFFSLADLNEKIENFNYRHLICNKPSPITVDHLNNGRLRQNASQMLCLGHVLPFLICDLLVGEDGIEDGDGHAHLKCHIQLLQIINVCFAYTITEDDAYFLGNLIESFIQNFVVLYGRDALVPKFHFLIHLVEQILNFGPPRQQFCFRFEAANARYKFLARVVRCFKNIPLTLSYRHEAQRCLEFSTEGEEQTRFLHQGHFIKAGRRIRLADFQAVALLLPHFPGVNVDECQIMISPKTIIWGTKFIPGSIILIDCNEADLPKFGKVENIVSHEGKILLVYREILTDLYFQNLNAYQVTVTNDNANMGIVDVKRLLYRHPLSIFRFDRKNFIILFNHTRTEFLL